MQLNSIAWSFSAGEPLDTDRLDGDTSTDLVIIGGGFTGCSAALHAAEAGLGVCLLEAETIGCGGSGRNVGLVNAGLWTPPEDVEQLLGAQEGRKLNEYLSGGPELVFELIRKHSIECSAIRTGTLHCAHSGGGMRDLERRYNQLRRYNVPVDILDASQTAARTGSNAFEGALFDPRAGTINPLAYCRGLARAAIKASAKFCEKTPATAIKRKNERWLVVTPTGSVSARCLMIATNAYTIATDGMPSMGHTRVDYCQFATAPLSDHARASILPGREGCWDTAPVMSSFRLDREGRLVIGGIGSLDHPAASIHARWAKRKLASLFPQLAEERLVHGWSGRIAMTRDHLPKILELGNSGYAVFGYSGRGIAPGSVFGKAVAQAIAADTQSELPLRSVESYSENFQRFRQMWFEGGALAIHALQSVKLG
ncbi:FAD-binding oxidoreductase [Hoeflea sp. WL0058]|uniref:FAD-binding oxidoreductase n=1 Tax=Flavimaribacter sediminis TaxID=2865987 RepID=A0AAE2ZM68_9HYPH|nr:FAD-binding oxidoreductase [Flavimaribacter sediminis]MBW8637045.1 FAD-binding oxidoreductase [Flavimaribacter sediminis]